MSHDLVIQLAIAAVSAAFAAGGAWLAVRTEMRWMRRDIDRNANLIEKVEERRHSDSGTLHDRITRLNERMTAAGVNGPRAER